MAHFLTVAITIVATMTVSANAQPMPTLPAPHQLIGVEQRLDEDIYERADGLTEQRFVIDLNKTGLPPRSEEIRDWTIAGSRGAAPATLVTIERRCEFLCGDELESCYYVAIVSLHSDAVDIGKPLAAFNGTFDLRNYHKLADGAPAISPLQIGQIYPGILPGEKYSIKAFDNGSITFGFHWGTNENDNAHYVQSTQCQSYSYDVFGLFETRCIDLFVLSADEEILLASYGDYNSSKTAPIAKFERDGIQFVIIRYDAKAQDVYGVIYRASEGWRNLIRTRNRPLLC